MEFDLDSIYRNAFKLLSFLSIKERNFDIDLQSTVKNWFEISFYIQTLNRTDLV